MKKYESAAAYLRDLVDRGVLKAGSKVPSIRKLSRQLDLSPITVQHAYELLQAAGVIEARPRSGYYVAQTGHAAVPAANEPVREHARSVSVTDLTFAMLSLWHTEALGGFGGIHPDPDALGTAQLHRHLRLASRRAAASRASLHPQEGNLLLRHRIARDLIDRGTVVRTQDVIITNTGMGGIDLCLDMLTERGDTVLLDTPTYLPLILSLQRKGLRVVELFSHPAHGVDPGQFSYLLNNYRCKAAILSPLNHFPTGVSSTPETMERLARIIDAHDVPLIEFDAFSELAYTGKRPQPLMAFIKSNNGFLFGSFLDTLGPDFSLSWVVSRQRSSDVMQRKFLNNLSFGDALLQHALAEYISTRQDEKDFRRLRRTLLARMERGTSLLRQMLPRQFSFAQPTGGYMCWIRGPSNFDAIAASKQALDLKLSLAPGPMFSPSEGFRNFVGMNFSGEWTEKNTNDLRAIVDLFHA